LAGSFHWSLQPDRADKDHVACQALLVADLGRADWERVRELVIAYASMPLGGTDASVVALAERPRAILELLASVLHARRG
jgi:uncharacterized protein